MEGPTINDHSVADKSSREHRNLQKTLNSMRGARTVKDLEKRGDSAPALERCKQVPRYVNKKPQNEKRTNMHIRDPRTGMTEDAFSAVLLNITNRFL